MTPILALGLPFGRFGKFASFLFCAGSIVLYDLATAADYFSPFETFSKAICYGLVGMTGSSVLQRKKNRSYWQSVAVYGGISVAGIIFFDAVTGVILPVLVYHGSFMQQLIGQITFTGYHLLSVLFVPIAPLIERWLADGNRLGLDSAASKPRGI